MAMLVKAMFSASKNIAGIQKDLGISKGEARGLAGEMAIAAGESGDLRVTTEGILKTNKALNSAFQTAAVLNKETLVSATSLLDAQVMSAEATSQLAGDAARLGMTFDESLQTQEDAVNAVSSQTGAQISLKGVLEASNQVTGQIRAQLGSNPEAIARAVTQAKALGYELEQIASAGKALLDFESSISAELEAELLTGKQLNLEKARLAALTGDYQTLTKEIMNNVGSETEFAQMNVIAKEKMAAALGMSVDKMSDLVYQNANLAELAQEARDRGDEELAASLEKRNVQQQLTDLQEKMADIAVTYLAPALDVVAGIIGYMADNSFVLYGVLGLMGALKLGGIITSVLGLAGALTSAGVAGAGVASALTLGIGAVAIAGGIALIVSSMSKARDQEMAAINTHGLFNLSDFLPKKPDATAIKVMQEMFEASVDGEAYDADRWSNYFRPSGMAARTGDPQKAASPQATAVSQSAPAPVAEAAPVAPAPAPEAAPTPVAETAQAAEAPAGNANDILAMIRQRKEN